MICLEVLNPFCMLWYGYKAFLKFNNNSTFDKFNEYQ